MSIMSFKKGLAIFLSVAMLAGLTPQAAFAAEDVSGSDFAEEVIVPDESQDDESQDDESQDEESQSEETDETESQTEETQTEEAQTEETQAEETQAEQPDTIVSAIANITVNFTACEGITIYSDKAGQDAISSIDFTVRRGNGKSKLFYVSVADNRVIGGISTEAEGVTIAITATTYTSTGLYGCWVTVRECESSIDATIYSTERKDYTVTVTKDQYIKDFDLVQNGVSITPGEDGTYKVSNATRYQYSYNTAAGYDAYEKLETVSGEINGLASENYDSEQGCSVTYVSRQGNASVTLTSYKAYKLTLSPKNSGMEARILMNVPGRDNYYEVYVQSFVELNDDGVEQTVSRSVKVSGDCYVIVTSGRDELYPVASYKSDLSSLLSQEEVPDSEFWGYHLTLGGDKTLYLGGKWITKRVTIDDNISVSYFGMNDGENDLYKASADGKTLTIYSLYANVYFTVKNKGTNGTIRVYKVWNGERTEVESEYDEETGIVYYSVPFSDFDSLEIRRIKTVKVSLKLVNCEIAYDTEAYSFTSDGSLVMEQYSAFEFNLTPADGYVIDSVSDGTYEYEWDANTECYCICPSGDITITARAVPDPMRGITIRGVSIGNMDCIRSGSNVFEWEHMSFTTSISVATDSEPTSREVFWIDSTGNRQTLTQIDAFIADGIYCYTYMIFPSEMKRDTVLYFDFNNGQNRELVIHYDNNIESVEYDGEYNQCLGDPGETKYLISGEVNGYLKVRAKSNSLISSFTYNLVETKVEAAEARIPIQMAGEIFISGYHSILTVKDEDSYCEIMPSDLRAASQNYNLNIGDRYLVEAGNSGDDSIVAVNGNVIDYGEFENQGSIRIIVFSKNEQIDDSDYPADYYTVFMKGSGSLRIKTESGRTITVNVNAVTELKSVSVSGVNASNPDYKTLNIDTDSRKELIIKGSSGANLDALSYKFEWGGDVSTYMNMKSATFKTIELLETEYQTGSNTMRMVVAAGDYAERTATIILYNQYTNEEYERIHIKTVSGKAASVTPSVTVSSVDTVSATLKLSGAEKTAKAYFGEQYYKITAIPKDNEYDAGISAERVVYVSADTTTYRLVLNDLAPEEASACSFKLDVQYIQTLGGYNKDDINTYGPGCFISGGIKTLDVSTKNPYYETSLSLKAGAKTVYTGQSDILVSTAKYSSNTSFLSLAVEDITAGDEEDLLSFTVKEGKYIYASAGRNVTPGKHTIVVTPKGTDTMYVKPVSFTVTVVKGIDSLSVNAASEVYKQKGKALTINTGVVYNENETAPKTKKVTYEFYDENYKLIKSKRDAGNLSSPYDGMVTVKNSKITIAKAIDVTNESFVLRVKVKAADFRGNNVESDFKTIVVRGNYLTIGSVRLLKWDDDNNRYNVLNYNQSNAGLLTSELDDAMVVAFEKGAIESAYLYQNELDQYAIDPELYSVKSSNKKIRVENSDGFYRVSCSSVEKNIVFTATTSDGGKKSASLKVTTKYFVPDDFYIEMYSFAEGTAITQDATDGTTAVFDGFENAEFGMKLYCLKDGDSVAETNLANYSVSVSGGKKTYSNYLYGNFVIAATAPTTKITVTNKAYSKTNPLYQKVYTVTNTMVGSKKAPSVTQSVTIKSDAGFDQTIKLKVGSKNYDSTGKYAVVTMGSTGALSDAMRNKYFQFADRVIQIAYKSYIPVEKEGNSSVLNLNAGNEIEDGTYPLSVVFGRLEGGTFVPETKAVSVKVKAAKPAKKTGWVKFTSAYNFVKSKTTGTYDNTSVELKYTKKNYSSMDFLNVKNCNVNGQENAFSTYFDIVCDGMKTTIRLKDSLTEEEKAYILSGAGAKDRSGYLVMGIYTGDDGYGIPNYSEQTVKITINLR